MGITMPEESTLPDRYVEIGTSNCPEGHCHFDSFVNHRTPSGFDRPYLHQSSVHPLVLSRLLDALAPGTIYFLNGVRKVRDDRPIVPYTDEA